MEPLFFTLHNNLPLKVVPKVEVVKDGHPILCYKYSLFLNKGINPDQQKKEEPDYYGYITIETPGKVFSYEEGERCLTRAEIEEVIEYISEVRDNPASWKSNDL